jgi:hypothetical protein
MKKALVRLRCSVPDSDGWKRTPCRRIQSRQRDDSRITGTRQRLVGLAAGDLQQVLPELFFRVGLGQHVLRRVVHAAQVARVHRIAAAPLARCRFEHQHGRAGLACHQRGTQRGVATTDHEHVQHPGGPLQPKKPRL